MKKDQNRLLELIISAAIAEAKATEDDPINEAAPLKLESVKYHTTSFLAYALPPVLLMLVGFWIRATSAVKVMPVLRMTVLESEGRSSTKATRYGSVILLLTSSLQ